MPNGGTELLDDVAHYYAAKLAEHGESPRGVDWNGAHGQVLRFEQLCKLIPLDTTGFSLLDLGCGYGALLDHIRPRYEERLTYLGVDVCEDMVRAARTRHAAHTGARFSTALAPDTAVDYAVASGIFSVRLQHDDDSWFDHLRRTLDMLHSCTSRGFGFNCLTSYSDENRKRGDLYYADPCKLFDLCKRRYAQQVALLHDYGLYEFTILVRKQA